MDLINKVRGLLAVVLFILACIIVAITGIPVIAILWLINIIAVPSSGTTDKITALTKKLEEALK